MKWSFLMQNLESFFKSDAFSGLCEQIKKLKTKRKEIIKKDMIYDIRYDSFSSFQMLLLFEC
jgi:hypothetical protein